MSCFRLFFFFHIKIFSRKCVGVWVEVTLVLAKGYSTFRWCRILIWAGFWIRLRSRQVKLDLFSFKEKRPPCCLWLFILSKLWEDAWFCLVWIVHGGHGEITWRKRHHYSSVLFYLALTLWQQLFSEPYWILWLAQ